MNEWIEWIKSPQLNANCWNPSPKCYYCLSGAKQITLSGKLWQVNLYIVNIIIVVHKSTWKPDNHIGTLLNQPKYWYIDILAHSQPEIHNLTKYSLMITPQKHWKSPRVINMNEHTTNENEIRRRKLPTLQVSSMIQFNNSRRNIVKVGATSVTNKSYFREKSDRAKQFWIIEQFDCRYIAN